MLDLGSSDADAGSAASHQGIWKGLKGGQWDFAESVLDASPEFTQQFYRFFVNLGLCPTPQEKVGVGEVGRSWWPRHRGFSRDYTGAEDPTQVREDPFRGVGTSPVLLESHFPQRNAQTLEFWDKELFQHGHVAG